MKRFIKRIIRTLGWDLHRFTPSSDPSNQLLAALEHTNINTIFDIGANVGQFSLNLRAAGFKGKIVSFEPTSCAYPLLLKKAELDSKWFVHSRNAIGDKDGITKINISGNSVSSSILPMLDSHISAAQDSNYLASEKITIARLDSISEQYLTENSNLFLKIDTQGYEWQVLDGAPETLKKTKGILIELSLVPLYEGQKLWCEIISRLKKEGFKLWTLQPGFTDPRTGQSLQMDAIFLRSNQ